MTLDIFFRMDFLWFDIKRHCFLWDLILFRLCFDFGLNKLFLLFFVFFLFNFLLFTNKGLCSLYLFMLSFFIQVNIFGNSWRVIINVHTINVFLHLKGFLMNIIWGFRIFPPLRTQTRTNVSHFLVPLKCFLSYCSLNFKFNLLKDIF